MMMMMMMMMMTHPSSQLAFLVKAQIEFASHALYADESSVYGYNQELT